MEENNISPDTPLSKLVKIWENDSDVESGYDPELGAPLPENWIQLATREFKKAAWRIQDFIPSQGVSIVAAIAGEGKTWMAMYIAKCISESIPFLGQFKTMSGRVLYINAEMSESEMQRRGKLLGIEENNINIYFLNRDDFNIYAPTNAVDTIDYKWLLQYVYQNKIDVVVVDTFRAVAGGLKEEQAGEVRTMFKKLNILKNSGVSVIVLDHYRKPSNFDRKVPKKEHLFGSVDKVANAEILLMLRNEGNGEMHLYQTKNRLSKEMDPFIVRMEDFTRESGEPGVRFVYIGKLEEKESKKDEAKEMILSALVDGGRTRPDIIAMLRESKIGEKNISDALRELEKAQTIDSTQQGHRKFYFLPQVKDVDLSEMDTIIPQEEG